MSWNDGRSPNFCLIFDSFLSGRAALCAHKVPDAQQAWAYSLDAAALTAHHPAHAPASASRALPALPGPRTVSSGVSFGTPSIALLQKPARFGPLGAVFALEVATEGRFRPWPLWRRAPGSEQTIESGCQRPV